MRKRRFLNGLVVMALVAFAAVLLRPTQAKSAAAETRGSEIKVDNFTFGPETITVAVNSTVTWVNKDDIPHVIASNDGLFKSKALDTDDKFSYTFTKPGTYAYFCAIHPKMVGKVVVQ
jgi:plastocyanin